MNQSQKEIVVITLLIIAAIATRFLFLVDGESALPNFSAVGAVAIFGACYFRGNFRFIVPLSVLWLSDLILNNVIYSRYYAHFQIAGDPWVYSGFVLAGIIAYFLMKKSSWPKLLMTSIVTGVIFYLVSNFGVWMSASVYSKDLGGLLQCYAAGIPFFRNTILGNVFYSFVLFGIYEWILSDIFDLRRLILVKA